jgi:Polyketide cyclase / dehydrase and lipid transport
VATATETLVIPRSAEEIFDFLEDGSRNHLWQPEVASVILAAGPPERAIWAQTIRRDGRERKSDYRVTFYDRPRQIEFTVVSGSPQPTYTYALHSIDANSTRVTLTVEVVPRWAPLPTVSFGRRQALIAAQRIHDLAEALGK